MCGKIPQDTSRFRLPTRLMNGNSKSCHLNIPLWLAQLDCSESILRKAEVELQEERKLQEEWMRLVHRCLRPRPHQAAGCTICHALHGQHTTRHKSLRLEMTM